MNSLYPAHRHNTRFYMTHLMQDQVSPKISKHMSCLQFMVLAVDHLIADRLCVLGNMFSLVGFHVVPFNIHQAHKCETVLQEQIKRGTIVSNLKWEMNCNLWYSRLTISLLNALAFGVHVFLSQAGFMSHTRIVHVFLSQAGFMYRTCILQVSYMFSCPKQVSCIVRAFFLVSAFRPSTTLLVRYADEVANGPRTTPCMFSLSGFHAFGASRTDTL